MSEVGKAGAAAGTGARRPDGWRRRGWRRLLRALGLLAVLAPARQGGPQRAEP